VGNEGAHDFIGVSIVNQQLTQQLCQQFCLGELLAAPDLLEGGFLHRLWRLKTTQGEFVLKQQPLDLVRENVLLQLQQAGVPAQATLALHHQGYALFAWIPGEIYLPEACSQAQVALLAQILFHMHQAKLTKITQALPAWPAYVAHDWQSLLAPCEQFAMRAGICSQRLSTLEQMALAAVPNLSAERVISHRDLYPANVLWLDAEHPVLIDWENLGWIHPLVDGFNLALNWQGNSFLQGKRERYTQVIHSYQQLAGHSLNINTSIVHASFFSWLDWLALNLQRLGDTVNCLATQRSRAEHEILHAHQVLDYLAVWDALPN
jgi:aminoglycoside phosphotransferase (APT) family kinase protein